MAISLRKQNLSLSEILFILAVGFKPLYLGESGGVQLSDGFFVLLFVAVFGLSPRLHVSNNLRKWLLVFSGTLLYQMLILCIWQIITDLQNIQGNIVISIAYYIFNFMIVCAVIKLHEQTGFERLVTDFSVGLLLSCIVCMVGMIVNPVHDIRQMGFFNNPNQLGYYSVIIYTAVLILKKYIPPTIRIVIIICACLFAVLSMSKAAIVSIAILLFLSGFFYQENKMTIKGFAIRLLTIVAFFVLVYAVLYSDWGIISNNQTIITMRYRMLTMFSENDSALGSGRGYDRLKEIGLNIVFGVGEGKYQRFTTMTGYETHSSYAALVVSYGLVGFFLYAVIIIKALKRNIQRYRHFIFCSGIFLYCVTHNGIRHTLLWVLIVVMMIWQDYSGDNNSSFVPTNRTNYIGT